MLNINVMNMFFSFTEKELQYYCLQLLMRSSEKVKKSSNLFSLEKFVASAICLPLKMENARTEQTCAVLEVICRGIQSY